MTFKNVNIIINPISGGKNKKEVGGLIQKYIFGTCVTSRVFFTSARGDASKFTKMALNNKCDLVVAVGGDGTINEIASELVNSNTTLAIIPMGSGNGFARSLEIPLKIKSACELIASGSVCAIDVGKINDRFFFLLVGIGFDAVVGRAFEEHNHRGPLPYFYLSAKKFLNYKPENFHLISNGKKIKISPFQLTIANGKQYGNNAHIAPDAILNDGLLNVYILHRLPFYRLFTQLPKMFLGKLDNVPDTDFFTSSHLKIIRENDAVINVDGEPINASANLEISLIPKSLKLVTPSSSAGLL